MGQEGRVKDARKMRERSARTLCAFEYVHSNGGWSYLSEITWNFAPSILIQ